MNRFFSLGKILCILTTILTAGFFTVSAGYADMRNSVDPDISRKLVTAWRRCPGPEGIFHFICVSLRAITERTSHFTFSCYRFV